MKRLAVSLSWVVLVACNATEVRPQGDVAASVPPPSASVTVAPAPPSALPAAPASRVVVIPPESAEPVRSNTWGTVDNASGPAVRPGTRPAPTNGGARVDEVIGIGSVKVGGTGAYQSAPGALGGNDHATKAPRLRQGEVTIDGPLPSEVILRITRQNFGRHRLCYETGLAKDPKLAGQVAVHFVIDGAGHVTKAEPAPSTRMPDPDVAACVVRGFSNLSFPQPDAGTVDVTYVITFEPTG